MPPLPEIDPPLLNSACLWASTQADITSLYNSAYTGAITTRTACHPTQKFPENPDVHRHAFSSSTRGVLPPPPASDPELETTHPARGPKHDLSEVSSLNTYGYAPLGLVQYIYMVKELERSHPDIVKPVIFSVTGDSETVASCWKLLTEYHDPARPWCMEINLSCPNIAGKPPPAYSKQQLVQFLGELREYISKYVFDSTEDLDRESEGQHDYWAARLLGSRIPIGLKLPPYTYAGQFDDVVEVIRKFNSEGFGIIPAGLGSDYSAIGKPAAVSNMTETAIDPTLLSSADVDNFVSELSLDMQSKLSLTAALDETTRATAMKDPKSFPELFRSLFDSALGKYIQTEVFSAPWPIAFVTSTNTLGSSLLMEETDDSWLPALRAKSDGTGSGIGGLAGAALHALALGNVANLKRRLRTRSEECVNDVKIIGVGGVSDSGGFERMHAAGANVVGLATALGARGVSIFEDILENET